MPPTVLQRLGEQLAPLVSVLGAGGAHVVQYGHGLAQPVHRRADIDEVGPVSAAVARSAGSSPSSTRCGPAARAVSISEYAAHVVPGLLQKKDYARAVLSLDTLLSGEEQLEERVAARLGRQERLASSDRPNLWVVLDEAVLRRPVGGRAVR